MQFKAFIVQMYRVITEVMCRRVNTNVAFSVSDVERQNGGRIEHVIRKG